MFIGAEKKYPIGIDISDHSFKLVELKKRRGKIGFQALGKVDLPPGVISKGEIQDEKRAVNFLHSLVNKPKFGRVESKYVVASLPEMKTFVKLLKINSAAEDVPEAVEAEAEKHIPFLADEVYMDWQEIGKDGKENKKLVLAGVSPKNTINQYFNLFYSAGLSVESLEVEPVAIVRSILKEENPNLKNAMGKNYIIVDLGYNHTTIIVYSKNTILFTSNVPFSGKEITEDIASKLDIKNSEAEKKKRKMGSKSKNYKKIKKVIDTKMEELDKRLGRVIEFYQESFSNRGHIDSLILIGGGAGLNGFRKGLSSLPASTEVVRGNPFMHLDIDKKSKEKIKDINKASFATSVGLGLSGVFKKEL